MLARKGEEEMVLCLLDSMGREWEEGKEWSPVFLGGEQRERNYGLLLLSLSEMKR